LESQPVEGMGNLEVGSAPAPHYASPKASATRGAQGLGARPERLGVPKINAHTLKPSTFRLTCGLTVRTTIRSAVPSDHAP